MKEVSAKWLERAALAIDAARRDLAADAPGFAAEHVYYGMFYTAQALLADRDLGFSSHAAVHGAFGKELAKTGELDPKFHRWMLDAFEERQRATYGIDGEPTREKVLEMISQAEEFLGAARAYLERSARPITKPHPRKRG